MAYPAFRRRRFLIDPHYQVPLAIETALFCIFYSFALGFIVFHPLQVELDATREAGRQVGVSLQILALNRQVWPAVLLIALLVGLQSIFVSHRVAGPIHRLKEALRVLARGQIPVPIHLRKGDQFTELGDLVNSLAGEVARRRSALLAEVTRLERSLGEGAGTAPPEVQHALTRIRGLLYGIEEDREIPQVQGARSEPVAGLSP